MLRIEFDRLPAVAQCLLDTIQCLAGIAAVMPDTPIAGFDGQRRIVVGNRAFRAIHRTEQIAATEPGLGQARIMLQHCSISLQGLLMAPGLAQQGSPMQTHRRPCRIEFDRPFITGERGLATLHLTQQVAKIAMGRGEVRLQADRTLIAEQRFFTPTQRLQRTAVAVPCVRIFNTLLQRPIEQGKPVRRLALLRQVGPQIDQGNSVPGRDLKNGFMDPGRFNKSTLPDQRHSTAVPFGGLDVIDQQSILSFQCIT